MSRHSQPKSPGFFAGLLRSVLTSLCTIIVVLALIAGGFWLSSNQGTDVDKDTWLVLDLYGSITEYHTPGGPMASVMGGGGLVLQDMLDNLGKAALDERIAGVIFKISASNNAGRATLEELRLAVDKVQAAGKPVYAWGDMLNLSSLYLASGCDKIMMPGGGYFEFKGMSAGMPFVRGILDKLGIVPHLHKIKEYKSAAELIMNTEMTEASREMRTWMMDDFWNMTIPVIAQERGLTEEKIIELMEYAEFLPSEAVEAGLISEEIYLQELQDRLKGEDDDFLRAISHEKYTDVTWDDVGLKTGETVAVVHAQGNIGGRSNRVDPVMGVMMGHESIIKQLQRCRYDEEVKAVVFRINSGGGESLASDLIAHEISLLAKVKPVVVSMLDVAASGGYHIAHPATYMMADRTSVTGSIGSINGIFNMSGLYEKIGFNKEFVTKGPNATLGSDMRDPTAAEWERHSDAHWKSYNQWLEAVAKDRNISMEELIPLTHGRVWTGRQAAENGLIDATGNLDDAIAKAVELAEMETDKAPNIIHLPEQQGLIESFLSSGPEMDTPVSAAMRAALYLELRAEFKQTTGFLQNGATNVVR